MSGLLIFLVAVAALAGGWYLFEWWWDRRLFSPADPDQRFTNLRARKIRDLLEDGKVSPKIVDVRPSRDFERGHLPAAVSFPYPDPQFEEQITGAVSRDEPLLIYCSGGFRSRFVAAELRRLGFEHLYHLHRGIGSWKMAGLPTETNR